MYEQFKSNYSKLRDQDANRDSQWKEVEGARSTFINTRALTGGIHMTTELVAFYSQLVSSNKPFTK